MTTKQYDNTQRYLNLWAFVLIIWTIYRTKFSLPDNIDEFIVKPLVFLLPIIVYVKTVEKKPILEGLGFDKKKFFPDLIIGLGVGLLFFSFAVVLKYFKNGSFTPFEFNVFASPGYFWSILALSLATAVSEEVLSRGFILKRLYEDSKNVFSASFLSSILFFILHIPIMFSNTALNGTYLIFFMTIYLSLGLANSFIFLLRKNVVLPILIYTFYNLTIMMYF